MATDAPIPAPGSAAWWRDHRTSSSARRPRTDGITIDRILEAALAILDEHGPDALTMRHVADELGTGAASLYRHVAGRDELVVLIVDHVLGELSDTSAAGAGWQERAEAIARNVRSHLLAHRSVVPLISGAQLLGPNSMRGRDVAIRLLIEAGLAPHDAACAYLTIVHFVVANVQLEVIAAARSAAERAELRELFRDQDPERHPAVVEYADVIAAQDSDTEFEFGLWAILDGIAYRVSGEPASAGGRRAPGPV